MRYQLKALREPEGIVCLTVDAADEADASRQAQAGGYSVLSLKRAGSWSLARLRGDQRFPLALFNQELLALLGAGLNLVEAIEGLAEKEAHPPTRAMLETVCERLKQGRTLSQAMEELPHAFPALYVSTVKATERTGDLQDALSRYVAYQSQLELVRKKVINASIYPALLIIVGALVLLFLLGYVVPKFSLVFEEVQDTLPLPSRLLLQAGKALETHGVLAAALALSVMALLARLAFAPGPRRWVAVRLWQIPAIGARMRLYQLARFYRTLSMLLRGGTPIVSALDLASGLLSTSLRPNLQSAREAIREGRSISEAMDRHGLATPVALRMLRVGERSGRMDEMMDRIAGFLDEEIARWVEWFTRLFEPLLMAFIGLVIGAIVILMYMPVFDLAGSIQ